MGSGFSKARLDYMHEVMAGHVERGAVPGLVTLVARHGEVHVDALGTLAFRGAAPVRRDSLFRITSMTKAVTAVATMLLVEECKIRLDEPVDRLLPELADRMVLVSLSGPFYDQVPAHRPITVRDLLTFRMGYGMLLVPPGTFEIQSVETDLGLRATGPPLPRTTLEPDEWMRRFGTLPLLAQPGERWMYNTGSHVLSVLIARASGQSLPEFLRERIFEPLGMVDTSFTVPANKQDRFATQYGEDADERIVVADEVGGQWSVPPSFPDAAAGLVSTVDDYYAFASMLLRDGMHEGERILSRASVELLRTDQLTPEQHATAGPILDGSGWGFGVAVTTQRTGLASVGQYGWDGGFGTTWRNDPRENLIAIQFTQRMWGNQGPLPVYYDFWTSVYTALAD
jgi:CubicO group peptidase (beta-lactamase class C family)